MLKCSSPQLMAFGSSATGNGHGFLSGAGHREFDHSQYRYMGGQHTLDIFLPFFGGGDHKGGEVNLGGLGSQCNWGS